MGLKLKFFLVWLVVFFESLIDVGNFVFLVGMQPGIGWSD